MNTEIWLALDNDDCDCLFRCQLLFDCIADDLQITSDDLRLRVARELFDEQCLFLDLF